MDDGAYWFVNICEYTRWATVDKIKSVSFESVEPLLEKLFDLFGNPLVYKTDNGSPFQSSSFSQFCTKRGVSHRKVTPFWPRANSGVETFMKKLGKVLRVAKVAGKSKDEALKEFLRVYRDTPHSTTGVSPNMLMFGYARTSGIPHYDQKLDLKKLAELHEYARRNDEQAKEQARLNYDKHMRAKECKIELGDKVLFKLHRTNKNVSEWDSKMGKRLSKTKEKRRRSTKSEPHAKVRRSDLRETKTVKFEPRRRTIKQNCQARARKTD